MSSKNVFLNLAARMWLSMQTLKKEEWTEISWRSNVCNAKFSVDTRLEHGFPIDKAYLK